jgi:hypothetical protein
MNCGIGSSRLSLKASQMSWKLGKTMQPKRELFQIDLEQLIDMSHPLTAQAPNSCPHRIPKPRHATTLHDVPDGLNSQHCPQLQELNQIGDIAQFENLSGIARMAKPIGAVLPAMNVNGRVRGQSDECSFRN